MAHALDENVTDGNLPQGDAMRHHVPSVGTAETSKTDITKAHEDVEQLEAACAAVGVDGASLCATRAPI